MKAVLTAEERAMRQARKKFLHYFPKGFYDQKYLNWERNYKWQAHRSWEDMLGREEFSALLEREDYQIIARRAASIESKTNLLFSFEKMALRDAVKSAEGARDFSEGLFALLHGEGTPPERFNRWCATVASLPRRQTRVLTWPLATVFAFIAQPKKHFFVKPLVTRRAADKMELRLDYNSKPSYTTYRGFLDLARQVKKEIADLQPRDLIDVQSFIWVQGSEEYPD